MAVTRSPMAVSFRIPAPLAARLDTFLGDRLIRVPRHAWIRQAILEKLDRETGEQATTRESLSFSHLSGSLLHG